ncbi:hypothetical protein E3O62_02600 [Cryobacterium sp. TMT2-15-1]|uniref:hypothetical protein n=1 Tax=Cryobacterium sp. TMT2-15-1 TaxID=1259246 RepID=UPI00106AE45A|nr:hypothetical protein [Cryobacterium sp. TMT2-15-1]TFC63735.1 hypothetical protein E3O62_02600 [Cryobacterium sp. TMT2-15-1]
MSLIPVENLDMGAGHGISASFLREINRVYDNMPEAEQNDLAKRFNTYALARRRLPGAVDLLSSGRFAFDAATRLIPYDYAETHLTGYIAELRTVAADFEKYARDLTRVFG